MRRCPHGVLPDACVECAKAPRDGVEQERDALRAEVAALREALRKVMDCTGTSTDVWLVARNALDASKAKP